MDKGNKNVVLIILLIVFIFVGLLLNDVVPGLGGLIGGGGIMYLYFNLIKKDKKEDNDEAKDITLKK